MVVQLAGERAGFLAVLFLVSMPRYYGHMFFNPKDIPFAATYLLSIWALVRMLKCLPDFPSWKAVTVFGGCAGLAISSRIGGLLVLFYFAVSVFVFLALKYSRSYWKSRRVDLKALQHDLIGWALRGALSGLIAYVILMIFWPTGHGNPFITLGGAIGEAQSYGWDGLVLMDGHFWAAQDLPVYYILYWLLVAVPELFLGLCGAFFVFGILWLWARIRASELRAPAIMWPYATLAFSLVFPFGYMLWKQPVLYDGMRHFLFLLPLLACLSALSLE